MGRNHSVIRNSKDHSRFHNRIEILLIRFSGGAHRNIQISRVFYVDVEFAQIALCCWEKFETQADLTLCQFVIKVALQGALYVEH